MEFWGLWGFTEYKPNLIGENPDWDNWFLELEPEKLENYNTPHLYYKE